MKRKLEIAGLLILLGILFYIMSLMLPGFSAVLAGCFLGLILIGGLGDSSL